MKKLGPRFFVVYCPNNSIYPVYYSCKRSLSEKLQSHDSLQVEGFDSEIEAEKFIYLKKITHLRMQKLNELKQKLRENKGTEEAKAASDQQEKPTQALLAQAFRRLLSYQGDQKKFIKSVPTQKIKSNIQYEAYICVKLSPSSRHVGVSYLVVSQSGHLIFSRHLNLGTRPQLEAELFALNYCLMDCKMNSNYPQGATGLHGFNQLLMIIARHTGKSIQWLDVTYAGSCEHSKAESLAEEATKKKCYRFKQ